MKRSELIALNEAAMMTAEMVGNVMSLRLMSKEDAIELVASKTGADPEAVAALVRRAEALHGAQ